MEERVLNLNLDFMSETNCAELAFGTEVLFTESGPKAISVFTNVTIQNRDEKIEKLSTDGIS